MKKTRTLADGRTVTLNDNDGIRKRCDCARRKWATCPHSWFFSFKWGPTHYRFPVDRQAGKHIADRSEAKHLADNWRCEIRENRFVPYKDQRSRIISEPTQASELTFEAFTTKWRERGISRKRGRKAVSRAELSPEMQANDRTICTRLGKLVIDGQPLATRPIGRITGDDLEQVFAQLHILAGSTWNKYRDAVRMMQAWGVRKGYLARPWFDDTDPESAITRMDGARRDRRLAPDVCDEDGKLIRPGEERRLLAAAGPWLQRLIIAALETGCRQGELLSLLWGDVDLTRRT